jgi:tetratricopeptide (TPR) repeat protein
MADLQRSVYLAPYQDEPHLLLGRLYERAGRVGEAIDEFKVALWCRETAGARIALGRAYVASGDKAAARQEFERALILAPDSAEARDWLRKIGGLDPQAARDARPQSAGFIVLRSAAVTCPIPDSAKSN